MNVSPKFKTITVVMVTEKSDQSEQDIFREVMEEMSRLSENESQPIDTSIESKFSDADLSTQAASNLKQTLTENRGKTHSEVLDTDEFETEDSGSVKTSLKDFDSLQLIAEIWIRSTRYVTYLTQKGYRIVVKKCKEDGLDLNDKFKQ